MIRKVVIRRFKRFDEVEFNLPGHVVLAGPNNMGKTTVLQAIGAWSLAFNRWKELNDFNPRRHGYGRVPITRQAFSAVPLRTFKLLWRDRNSAGDIEIGLQFESGPLITMEFQLESMEQIYVRPKTEVPPADLKSLDLRAVFVPAMTGIPRDEPVYQPPYIREMLGMAKPGDILRNLLVEAHHSETAWRDLKASMMEMFGCELSPPDGSGAYIVAEYQEPGKRARFDIGSAGSGFQQVLMLLTFLNIRPSSVLLLDEPDAHLHVILQDAIYGELTAVALKQKSQLILATHSEVIIDSVDPRELYVMLKTPRPLSDSVEKSVLIRSLRVLSNTDIVLAEQSPGVLYLEGHTDLSILREWARVLKHPLAEFLLTRVYWKPCVWETHDGATGVKARDHYEALRLVRADLPGLILVDGDAHPEVKSTPITGKDLQCQRWKRYETESYLLHPTALMRFVEEQVGKDAAKPHVDALVEYFRAKYPPDFLKNPLEDTPFLMSAKARTDLIPPALDAAGLPGIPYTRFHEIAAVMLPEEIHPEVKEKLDAIQKAFNL